MYLVLENGSRFLVFNRLDNNIVNVELFDFGFVESVFNSANFTLEITDLAGTFEGTLNVFEITLIQLLMNKFIWIVSLIEVSTFLSRGSASKVCLTSKYWAFMFSQFSPKDSYTF